MDKLEEGDSVSDSHKRELGEKIEDFLLENRYRLSLLLLGSILIGLGVLYFKSANIGDNPKIEVLESSSESHDANGDIVVEIAGAVEKPGVYKLPSGSRVEDLLIAAGGVSATADREWLEKYINRAAKLADGQKIYIPELGSFDSAQDEHLRTSSAKNGGDTNLYQGSVEGTGRDLININTAGQKELEDLPGIGPVYAQNIIEQRPYSTMEELVSKGALKQHVYEKIKDKVTVY